jgi:hypothetical protein
MANDRYRYLYYNLNDTSFTYNFNVGKCIKAGHSYKLFPDSIDHEQYPVDVNRNLNNAIGNRIKIRILTDITDEFAKQYSIQIFNEHLNLIFHGTTVDTTISDLNLKEFKVKIDLANKFVKGMGNQSPTFTSVTSERIIVNSNENDITIHMPISFATYFYKYQKEIDLRDSGLFWEMNGRKILMRDVNF